MPNPRSSPRDGGRGRAVARADEGVWDEAGHGAGPLDRGVSAEGEAGREMTGGRVMRRGRVVSHEGEGVGDGARRRESARDRVEEQREAGRTVPPPGRGEGRDDGKRRKVTGARSQRHDDAREPLVSRPREVPRDETGRRRVERQGEYERAVADEGEGTRGEVGFRGVEPRGGVERAGSREGEGVRGEAGFRGVDPKGGVERAGSRADDGVRGEVGFRGVEPKGGVERAGSGEGEGSREAGRRRAARERAASRRRKPPVLDQAKAAEAGGREGSRRLGAIFPPRPAAEVEVGPAVDSPGGHASDAVNAGAVASSLADTLPADQAELRNALDLLLRYAAHIEGDQTGASPPVTEARLCDGKPFGIATETSGDP